MQHTAVPISLLLVHPPPEHRDWHSWAKLWSHTQLPVSLQDERPEVVTRFGSFFCSQPGRCVNTGWRECWVSVSDWGQRKRDYTTNPMFVWHQYWSLNPDCCCLTISSQLACQHPPPTHASTPKHTHTPGYRHQLLGSAVSQYLVVHVCVWVKKMWTYIYAYTDGLRVNSWRSSIYTNIKHYHNEQ